MESQNFVVGTAREGQLSIAASGAWTADNAARLESGIDEMRPDEAPRLQIDMGDVEEFDTFGAWILERLMRGDGRPREVSLVRLPDQFRDLVEDVRQTNRRVPAPRRRIGWPVTGLVEIGRGVEEAGAASLRLAAMVGALVVLSGAALVAPRRFRAASIVNQLDRVGLRSVPIIVLITLLIGAIIAQQGFFHFRQFGADDYVVDLVGILTLREIGVLIVSIMVAGRSGSSYTAELGAMKMREEIDALRTMGRDPLEVLVMPRVFALVVALPLLALIGSIAALVGGGIVAAIYGMEPSLFIARLREAVSISDFEVGMIKAPFMALVIGLVACTEGFQVRGSSESLGARTTGSVVKAIFLVIVLDGIFAMFFSSIGM
ncbi:MAG: MlaE family lipid ABC transporter permease subunit [Roseiarcus sp.]|jgi:phospholipid/cholesterol/gamma-HCH transport system permease protein